MARIVLPVAGAIVGGFYGGPTGAQLGWAIGSAVAGAVDPQTVQGPRVGEVSQQTSQEGGPRPIIYALSPPISGNIIATGEPDIVRSKQSQGKGGPKVETESVYRTYAIGISETITGFYRVWRNGILVYDASQGLSAENAKFLERARFFLGTFDQNPSPDLEAIFGVGTTPAHRGTAYLVMANDDLTDLRGSIPQYTFQVGKASQPRLIAVADSDTSSSIATSADGITWTMRSHPECPLSGVAYSPALGRILAVSPEGKVLVSDDSGETWTLHSVTGWFLDAEWSPSLALFVAVGNGPVIKTSPDGVAWTDRTAPAGVGTIYSIVWDSATGKFYCKTNAGQSVCFSPDGINWTNCTDDAGMHNGSDGNVAVGDGWLFACNANDFGCFRSNDGGVNWQYNAFAVGSTAVNRYRLACGNDRVLTFTAINENVRWSANDGVSWTLVNNGDLPAGDLRCGCLYFSEGLNRFICLTSAAGSPSGAVLTSEDGEVWEIFPGALSARNWTKVISGGGSIGSYDLLDVVLDICSRANLPSGKVDVSSLTDKIRGFAVTNSYPAFESLRALSEIFHFDPSNYDGVLHFVPRGGNSVATVDEDSMVDDDVDFEQEKRSDAISIPRVLHLNYHDVSGGLNTDKQSSERAGDRRSNGEISLQTAVLMNANESARTIAVNHKVLIEDQKGELRFSLPDSLLRLVPSNPIIVQRQGKSERARIIRCDIHEGYQEYRLLRDRQSANTSNVEGIPAAPQTPPPSSVVGPTLIEPLDIHVLRDSDDALGLGYYIAISGILDAWQGATVELSLDGGANYINESTWTIAAIMGETISSLPDHPQAYPDEVNTVSVRIDTTNGELEETDLEGLLNRQNLALIGNEEVQFANADELSEGTWDISYLLRGRRGTDTSSHSSGERFILLDRNTIPFIPAELVYLGKTLTFRATSFGNTPELGTVVSMSFSGVGQTERRPAYLQAYRDGTDLVMTWQGVGRLGAGALVAHGAYFLGYRVNISDGTLTRTYDTLAQELTEDVSDFTGDLTVSVQQRNQFTGLGPSIEVIV